MNGKKWLVSWTVFILVFGAMPYGFVYIFLKSNYENNSFEEIVERQLDNDSIYGTALNKNPFLYKLELIKKIKPKVVALGSSRVMQFRGESFKASFVNAGGGMNHLNEGYKFLDEMYATHKPEYIIMGLDFWWFNDNYIQPKYFYYHNNNGLGVSYKKIIKVFLWLLENKIKVSFDNIFSDGKIKNKYTDYDNLGFDAIATSDGFRSDGSYSYVKTILGVRPALDEKFVDTLNRVQGGKMKFQYGNNVSEERLKIFKKIIKLVKQNDTELILLIPPIANNVFLKMKNYNYKFISKLQKYVALLDVESHDYHDSSKLHIDNCEYIDGFHGGDVIYQRILKNMHDNKSIISKYLKIKGIEKNISNFQGRTLTILDGDKFISKETDYLKLGCNK